MIPRRWTDARREQRENHEKQKEKAWSVSHHDAEDCKKEPHFRFFLLSTIEDIQESRR